MTFEARSSQANLWKKLVEAMRELVSEVNMKCTNEGISVQSMDAAHVALVSMELTQSGFELYHMERETVIGVNMGNLAKILKTVEGSDSLEFKHSIDDNVLTITAEHSSGNRAQEYALKLMEIDSEDMSVPDIEYMASITMGASEFAKICRDMAVFGDTISVSINREGVKFWAEGDIGTGATVFKCNPQQVNGKIKDATAAAGGIKQEVKTEADAAVKQEVKQEVKAEPGVLDEDAPLSSQFPNNNKSQGGTGADDADGEGKKGAAKKENVGVQACMTEATELSFALRYFTTFSKGSTLADKVSIYLSAESPCKIEYIIEPFGHLSFFLAPKVESTE